MADDKPIIIIKKKGGHGGHHGGAWKVAYADFVTAMMAFFMVMWLVNSAETATKKNIASYFRRPGIFESGSGTPLLIGNSGILPEFAQPLGAEKSKKSPDLTQPQLKKSGSEDIDLSKKITIRGEDSRTKPLNDTSDNPGILSENPGDKLLHDRKQEMLEKIAEDLKEQIKALPELSELLGVVDVKIEADGLNMEIMDTDKTSMFASGSARIQPEAQAAFTKISTILQKLDNKVDIIGHTDAKPFASRGGGYSNWELSGDRANAARRLLEQAGMPPERITSVVGRADKELRKKEDPLASSNRRITLKMRFDFSKKIDLSKDPEALNKIPEYQKEADDQRKATAEERQKRLLEKNQTVHSLTTKDILQKKDKNLIKLPDDYDNKQKTISHSKDKIFGNSPVLGAPDVIYGE